MKRDYPGVIRGLRSRVARGGIVLAGEAGAALLGLAAVSLSVRYAGVENFGRYGIAAAIVATFGLILDVRVEDVAGRRFQEGLKRGTGAEQVWSTYYLTDMLFGLLRYGALLAVLPLITRVYGEPRLAGLAALLGLALTIGTADNSIVAALNARKRSGVIAAARLSGPMVRLCLLLALRPGDPVGLGWALVAGSLASTAVLVVGGRRFFARPLDRRGRREERKRSARTIVQISLAGTLRGAGSQADVLIVGAVLGAVPTGIYQLARSFAAAPAVIAAVIRFIEVPRAMDEAIQKDYRALKRTFTRVSVACGAVGLLALVGWLAIGGVAVRHLTGAQPSEVTRIAAILLLAATLEYSTSWSKVVPAALERGGFALAEAIWYGAAPLALVACLTKPFGLAGAAAAAVVVSGGASMGWLLFLRRLGSLSPTSASRGGLPVGGFPPGGIAGYSPADGKSMIRTTVTASSDPCPASFPLEIT